MKLTSVFKQKMLPAFLISLFMLLPSCSFFKEISALGKCEFRMGTLDEPRIAGIDVNGIRKFSDLGLADAAIVGTSLLRGELPLSFILNIEARNPNSTTAALNRLEYIAFIDDTEVARGALDERVEIAGNGGIANIPLQLQTDLVRILNQDSRAALFNFGLNLADASDRPTRVSIKVKPTVMVGVVEITYPGYFTVKHEFTSGD